MSKRTLEHVINDVKFSLTVPRAFEITDMAELSRQQSRDKWRGWFKLEESESKNGLIAWDASWYDHHTKRGGDVIDVFGYSIYGHNWKNSGEQFIEALRQAAQQAGVEWAHMTEQEKKQAEQKRRLHDVLTKIADFYHVQLTPKWREFLHKRYGLTDDTINTLKIGWSTPDWSKLVDHLKNDGFSDAEILATGLASETKNGSLIDFFRGRLVFPYWNAGRVVYFIARQTDETPEWIDEKTGKNRVSKYIKQRVHGHSNPRVSKNLQNDYFYSEDAVHGTDVIYITEGVTDCILANQEGFPCISPVTIQFKKSDWPRLLYLVKNVGTIYLAFDNEENAAGAGGCLETAKHLWEHGHNPLMVTIPRPFGIDKVDLNDFLREKGADAFSKLLQSAKTLVDVIIEEIERLPVRRRDDKIKNDLIPLIADLYESTLFGFYCQQIRERLGINIQDTKRFVGDYRKEKQLKIKTDRLKRESDEIDLPPICTNDHHLPTLTALAWEAIHKANGAEPFLFRWANLLARVESSDYGTPILRPLSLDRMKHMLARVAHWHKFQSDGQMRSVYPPDIIVKDILATPDPSLPVLEGVTGAPAFSCDGTLQITEGYDARSKLYYNPAPGFNVPEVSERPTREELNEALGLVMVDILGEFPFFGPNDAKAERAHAVSIFLQPFCRALIPGATPMYLIEKPSPGTGATLMVQALLYPYLGGIVPATTEGRSEEEWRKRITAKLQDAPSVFFIDNLRSRLDSSSLASVITSQMWEDRILGVSEMTTIKARCLWIATGNNPSITKEIRRRCARIRLDADMADPQLRCGWRHPRLLDWVRDNRAKLCWAALTIIQNWIASDRPKGNLTLGMFDDWANVMGGILECAGVNGFLTNLKDFYATSDLAADNWQQFIAAWWNSQVGRDGVKSQDLVDMAASIGVELSDGGGRVVSLGKRLASNRDRQYVVNVPGGEINVKLRYAGMDSNAHTWRLEQVQDNEYGHILIDNSGEPWSCAPPDCDWQTPDDSEAPADLGSWID